ncbi:MAG TPA: nucleotide pyrophosphohydrolase [Acidobacteriaceae bacterium]|nr:nucleotide pyrophosphohydrolase [Acidobacteriaceae bacterium]
MDDPLQELAIGLRRFARERNWDRFHTPQNLAALVASEAGELLALFRWGQDAMNDQPEAVRHELADVFLGLVRLADVLGVDLWSAAEEKLQVNALRYPPGPSGPDRPAGST